MADPSPQREQKEDATKNSEYKPGGVSFVPQKESEDIPEEISGPSRDEVSRELELSGVSTREKNKNSPEKITSEENILRPLRTYKDDIAEVLRKTKGSKLSIRAAEEKRATKRTKEKETQKENEEKLAKEKKRIEQEQVRIEERQRLEEEKRERDSAEEKRLEERALLERRAKEETRVSSEEKLAKEKRFMEQEVEAQRERRRLEEEKRERDSAEEKRLEELKEVVVPNAEKLDSLQKAESRTHTLEKALSRKKEERVNLSPVKLKKKPNAAMQTAIISIVFVALGGGLLYGTYSLLFTEKSTRPQLNIKTIIFAEESQNVVLDTLSHRNLAVVLSEKKKSVSVSSGDIVNIHITQQTTPGKNVGDEVLPASLLLKELAIRAPSSLARSIEGEYMLGFYAKGGSFLILKPTFFENAFAGMLAWEPYMAEDLSPFFTNATDSVFLPTRKTTPGGPFKDLIIKNKDTRVLYDSKGDITLVYSFTDRNTLVIAESKKAFVEILKRLTSKKVTR